MDLKELREILQLLDEAQITEFELEKEGIKLRVKKATASSNHSSPPLAVPLPVVFPGAPLNPPVADAAAAAKRSASEAEGEAEADAGLAVVKSPIVGTFFRAVDPNSPPFVSVGDHVKVGQVLCIIEAMKLMNEIEAEVAGEIVKIHHENGQPIQYGEPIFLIRPG